MHKSVQSREQHKSNPALATDTLHKLGSEKESRDSIITEDAKASQTWRGLVEEDGGPLYVH